MAEHEYRSRWGIETMGFYTNRTRDERKRERETCFVPEVKSFGMDDVLIDSTNAIEDNRSMTTLDCKVDVLTSSVIRLGLPVNMDL